MFPCQGDSKVKYGTGNEGPRKESRSSQVHSITVERSAETALASTASP